MKFAVYFFLISSVSFAQNSPEFKEALKSVVTAPNVRTNFNDCLSHELEFKAKCEQVKNIPKAEFKTHPSGSVTVRSFGMDVSITGKDIYPLEVVLGHLDITPSELRGKSVISLGEGTSPLLPYLRKNGVKVIGLDLWYNTESKDIPNNAVGTTMRNYLRENRNWLVPGDAMNIPFTEGTFDVVVSHQLINHLDFEKTKFIQESLRILKPGGKAHFACLSMYDFNVFKKDLNESPIILNLQKTLGPSYKIEAKLANSNYSNSQKVPTNIKATGCYNITITKPAARPFGVYQQESQKPKKLPGLK